MVYQLRYKIELQEQAVFSQLGGNPNEIESEGYVPGSSIWGNLAGLVIKKKALGNKAHTDEQFQSWFLRDGLRFLNAYPTKDDDSIRPLPTPLSVQKEKKDENEIHDFVAYIVAQDEESSPKTTLKSIEGFVTLNGESLTLFQAKTTYNYHTTRNRLKGRAVKDEGAVFVYEALEAGQSFAGLIIGKKEDLAELQKLIGWTKEDSLVLRIGRSHSTQYGGAAKLTLLTAEPEEFSREIEEDVKIDPPYLVVTLTSHLLLPNENGYPYQIEASDSELENTEASEKETKYKPLSEEVAKALGLEAGSLRLQHSFAKRVLVGGYSSVWGMSKQQWLAFKTGSVFVFELLKGTPQFQRAEAQGLGLRKSEGYGSFVINWHGIEEKFNKLDKKNLESQKPDRVSEKFKTLVKDVITKQIVQQAEYKGREDSVWFCDSATFRYLTPALLGRLELALQNKKPQDYRNWLRELRKPATQQLERVRQKDDVTKSLFDQISSILSSKLVSEVIIVKDNNQVNSKVVQAIGLQSDLLSRSDIVEAVQKAYLLALFKELSRKKRTSEAS